jgi:hypothetical protein
LFDEERRETGLEARGGEEVGRRGKGEWERAA